MAALAEVLHADVHFSGWVGKAWKHAGYPLSLLGLCPTMDEIARAHLAAFGDADLASQVRLLGARLAARALPLERASLAAQLGYRASQRVLDLPETKSSFAALERAMLAKGAGQVKARALVAMGRCRIAEWTREQDELICDATHAAIAYDPHTRRVTFSPALGLSTQLERPYYKDYSTHYVLRTAAGLSHAIWKWDRLSDESDWVELSPTVGILDPRTLTGLSVRRATWIGTNQDLIVSTDANGWVTFSWLTDGTAVGAISTGGADASIALNGLAGPDTPSKVLWAAEKCIVCPCRLHAAVCTCLDGFATSWRSRWGALTGPCLAAAELVPTKEQLLERWPWSCATLDGTSEPSPVEFEQAVTELTLWALDFGDPVAEDVQRLEQRR